MNRKTVNVDGLLISYLEFGEKSSKPSIVMLHGWGSEAAVWQKIAEALVAIGDYHVIAIDFPGFGHSTVPMEPYNVSQYVYVLGSFLSLVSISHYHLIAHSFGGRITMKGVAEKELIPKQIVMTGAAGKRDVTPAMKTRQMLGIWGGKLKQVPLIGSIAKFVGLKMRSRDYAQLHGVMAETFKLVVNEDLTDYARSVSVPTLLIWGTEDEETPLQQGQDLHNLIEGSILKIFEGAGHYTFIDEPERFNSEILLFLQ